MLSTQQLLELVVANPDRSSCDMRFLLHIWEAFTQWCADKLADRVGVKVLPLGEFGFRRDVIGKMEFFNPMFLMNETFARSHNLHDRRPKTHVPSTEAVDLDLAKIAQVRSTRALLPCASVPVTCEYCCHCSSTPCTRQLWSSSRTGRPRGAR